MHTPVKRHRWIYELNEANMNNKDHLNVLQKYEILLMNVNLSDDKVFLFSECNKKTVTADNGFFVLTSH